MIRKAIVFTVALCVWWVAQPIAVAQSSTPDSLLAQLTALRDAFISQIKAEGFQPSIAAPTIILDNPDSFGTYEESKNLLHIAAWEKLSAEDQARFSRAAALQNNRQSGEQLFEDSVHHWIFVHELGHWWQACQYESGGSHYSKEYGANRIAAAYWRLKDPVFMERTAKRMETLMASLPSPVPLGHAKEKFFDSNYEKLGPTPAYRWFQWSMVLAVQAERPPPSFKETLLYPNNLK